MRSGRPRPANCAACSQLGWTQKIVQALLRGIQVRNSGNGRGAYCVISLRQCRDEVMRVSTSSSLLYLSHRWLLFFRNAILCFQSITNIPPYAAKDQPQHVFPSLVKLESSVVQLLLLLFPLLTHHRDPRAKQVACIAEKPILGCCQPTTECF